MTKAMIKWILGLLLITAIVFFIAAISFAGEKYTSQTTKNGDGSTTTCTNKNTGATHGTRNYKMGNTTTTSTPNYNIKSSDNNGVITYTYTDKNTGAIVGGSTWTRGHTTRSYGSHPSPQYLND